MLAGVSREGERAHLVERDGLETGRHELGSVLRRGPEIRARHCRSRLAVARTFCAHVADASQQAPANGVARSRSPDRPRAPLVCLPARRRSITSGVSPPTTAFCMSDTDCPVGQKCLLPMSHCFLGCLPTCFSPCFSPSGAFLDGAVLGVHPARLRTGGVGRPRRRPTTGSPAPAAGSAALLRAGPRPPRSITRRSDVGRRRGAGLRPDPNEHCSLGLNAPGVKADE